MILLTLIFTSVFVFAVVYFSAKPADIAGSNPQNVFYHHKTIPVVVQKEIMAALSFYPELKETPIDFVFDPNTSKSVMLSQPVVSSFFRGQKNRTYVIKINPRFTTTHHSIPIQDAPKKVLIGWFGHELGHITDYTHRDNFQMAWFGIRYITSDKYLMNAEKSADSYAVEHGMAEYLIVTKNFIMHSADLPQSYKDRIKRLYLSPQQIMDLVKKLKADTVVAR